MKIPVIKALVESYTKEELSKAEEAIIEEQNPTIEIGGDDEGEQLTHVYAAIQILNAMEDDNVDFKTALREYTGRVRNSIL
ncbi:DUF6952 family protein [Ekhidna sp.]|eukprot:CAMPEP_0119203266 /NCGR_PEP_ID=MMETSP1316-20130426/34187_1 /TAXON_ID=41880 /ORGANISM="Pycnococcus provasolii, Strain RCC2336" /LENGTH=80 /DNA_ID=CAMNT_0007199501 /DNA_START=225 /DNA_END=467 /DNA_ORIENTATION=+